MCAVTRAHACTLTGCSLSPAASRGLTSVPAHELSVEIPCDSQAPFVLNPSYAKVHELIVEIPCDNQAPFVLNPSYAKVHELIIEIPCNNQAPFVLNPSYAKGDLDLSYITSRIAGTLASASHEDVFWFFPVW